MPTQTPITGDTNNINKSTINGGADSAIGKQVPTKAQSAISTSGDAPISENTEKKVAVQPATPPASAPSAPEVEAVQKKKLFVALLHRGAHAKLSRAEAIARASRQKRVIGDRADRHWALLLVCFFVANIAFAVWHVMVFRGIAMGDLFTASSSVTAPKAAEATTPATDVPAEVRVRLETFSKRNDKVIKVVDPSI